MEPKDNPPEVTPENDESELDALINGDISKIKAEQPEAANPSKPAEEPTKVDEGAEVPPAKETPDDKEGSPTPDPAPEDFSLKKPVQAKFESDQSFSIRMQLFDLVQQKKAAKNPEEKSVIQEQMNEIREGFKSLAKTIIRPDGNAPDDVQPAKAPIPSDSVSRDELPKLFEEMRQQTETRVTIDSFFDKYPEFKDQDVRTAFIEFFDSNYKLEGKDSKGVSQVLELARSAVFRPNETIQERVLKGANVQEKVNAMQFPGGTIVRDGLTPEQQKSVDEMVATGLSEDKARQLILD